MKTTHIANRLHIPVFFVLPKGLIAVEQLMYYT